MDSMTKRVCRIRCRITTRVVVDIVIWFSVAIPVLYLFLHGTPYKRGFFCDDEAISYPYKPETISTSLLLVAGVIVSIVVVVITEVLNCIDLKCRQQCFTTKVVVYCMESYAIFLAGFILQQLVVEVVKNQMGVLRPNFFDVCSPHYNRTSCPGYITNYKCTGNNLKEIRESRLSFPSGHSSLAMYIAVFFCMHIENRLQIGFSHLFKLFMQSGLIFIALLCGLERVLDNKHHPSDIVAGFLLGMIVAVFAYHKVGRTVLKCKHTPSSSKLALQTKHNSCECCICEHTPEQEIQTPTPLLQNDYSDNGNNTAASTQIFKDTPFYVRRHYSTPITPSRQPEEIV